MELEELFVQIPFYDNYAVSNYGRVINVKTGIEKRQWLNVTSNRLKVRFHVLGAYSDHFVDDLVAEAFFVEWKPGIDIFYKNKNRYDCTVLNLSFDPKYKESDDGSTRRRIWVDNRGKIRNRD